MWKVIKYIIELKDQLHKLEDTYKRVLKERDNISLQYNALYFQIQNLLGENNEHLVAHYDGTDIPEYKIEEINYGDSDDK